MATICRLSELRGTRKLNLNKSEENAENLQDNQKNALEKNPVKVPHFSEAEINPQKWR